MLKAVCTYIDELIGIQDKFGASLRGAIFFISILMPFVIVMLWPRQIEKMLCWTRKTALRLVLGVGIVFALPALFWRWFAVPMAKIWSAHFDCLAIIACKLPNTLFWASFVIYVTVVYGFWRIWKHYTGDNHFRMRKVKNMLSHDAAICLWRQDFLGREPLVKVVIDVIMRANVCKEAEYIGLFGPWGSGKTSVMNLVRREMTFKESGGSYPAIFVDFKAWSFANSTDAIAGFLRMVIQALRRNGEVKTAHAFKALAQMHSLRRVNIKGGLAGEILEMSRQWFFATMYNEEKTLQRVRIALRAMQSRLVVIVDDLERISVHDVGTIIAFLKANFNFPNTVVVFLSDRNHLARSIALYLDGNKCHQRVEELGCQYLEKIITHQIDLPYFDDQHVWKYVIVELKKLLPLADCWNYNIDTDDGDEYETVRKYIKTTRDAKLFLSKVWTGIAIHKNATRTSTLNLHVGDFLALTAIKIWEPEVYSNLKTLIEKLIKRWKEHVVSLDWGMSHDEYDQWLARFAPSEMSRKIVLAFLEKRIGIIKRNDCYVLSGIGDVETRLSFRLASPYYYRLYFEDFYDLHYIPKDILNAFIVSISSHTVPFKLLEQLKDDGRLIEFISTIEGLNEFDDAEATITYFKALLWLSNQPYDESYFGWQQGELDYNGPFLYDIYIAIGRCILRYLRKWNGRRYEKSLLWGGVSKDLEAISAGALLLGASKAVPSCFLIWQFMSWDSKRQDNTNMQYAEQIFTRLEYEGLVDLYLDNIEILQREDKVFSSHAFFDLMRGWNMSLRHRNDQERYRRMRCAIFPSLSNIENVKRMKPLYERSVVEYGDGVVINGKSFLGIDIEFCKRFFGMILVRKIEKVLSTTQGLSDEMQMLACALGFAVEHNLDDKICVFEAQVDYVKKKFHPIFAASK